MNIMLMQTGWIKASCRVTLQLAFDPTCLPLRQSFPIMQTKTSRFSRFRIAKDTIFRKLLGIQRVKNRKISVMRLYVRMDFIYTYILIG